MLLPLSIFALCHSLMGVQIWDLQRRTSAQKTCSTLSRCLATLTICPALRPQSVPPEHQTSMTISSLALKVSSAGIEPQSYYKVWLAILLQQPLYAHESI